MYRELETSPNQRCYIGVDLRERVHDGRVLLHRQQHVAEAARHAAPLSRRIRAVQFSSEGENGIGIGRALPKKELGSLVRREAVLEFL